MMSAFFQFQHTLNRLFNNYIKLYDKFFMKYEGGLQIDPPPPPQEKATLKKPRLIKAKGLRCG